MNTRVPPQAEFDLLGGADEAQISGSLGDIHRDPPRLVAREQLGRWIAAAPPLRVLWRVLRVMGYSHMGCQTDEPQCDPNEDQESNDRAQ
jgi:hypothetical protein